MEMRKERFEDKKECKIKYIVSGERKREKEEERERESKIKRRAVFLTPIWNVNGIQGRTFQIPVHTVIRSCVCASTFSAYPNSSQSIFLYDRYLIKLVA